MLQILSASVPESKQPWKDQVVWQNQSWELLKPQRWVQGSPLQSPHPNFSSCSEGSGGDLLPGARQAPGMVSVIPALAHPQDASC